MQHDYDFIDREIVTALESRSLMRRALQRYAEHMQPVWTPVSEKLPDDTSGLCAILVIRESLLGENKHVICSGRHTGECWIIESDADPGYVGDITHWSPLPQIAKET